MQTLELLPLADRTATETGPAFLLDDSVRYVIGVLNVTAVSGASPSITVQLEDSVDGVTWVPTGAGGQATRTTVGVSRIGVANMAHYLRARVTAISGTITCQVIAAAR